MGYQVHYSEVLGDALLDSTESTLQYAEMSDTPTLCDNLHTSLDVFHAPYNKYPGSMDRSWKDDCAWSWRIDASQ